MDNSIEDVFYRPDIIEFNNRRITHLDSLCLPLSNKSVLEPGCGPGLISEYLYSLGCKVLPLEARNDIVDFYKTKYPSSNILLFDLEGGNWDLISEQDISIVYGILYHLSDPLKFIDILYEKTREFCVIETIVSMDTVPDDLYIVSENSNTINQSFSGLGNRPTRKILWNYMKTKFPYVYIPFTQTAHSQFPKQFITREDSIARFLIIGSKIKLDINTLSEELINIYD